MVTHLIITGASGKIGKKLVESLVSDQAVKKDSLDITCLVRKPFLPPLPQQVKTVFANLPKDLPDERNLPTKPIVVHLAAITHSVNLKSYTDINIEGTKSVINLAKSLKAQHFIFISTRYINPKGGAYCESKAKAEALVRKGNLPFTILRFGEVYGTEGKDGIDWLLDQVKKGRLVLIPGAGENKLAPLYIDDAVKAILDVIHNQPKNETTTITGPREYTLNDLVKKATVLYKTHPLIIHLPIWLLRISIPLACLLPKPPIYPDQIDRMLINKDIATKETLNRLKPKDLFLSINHG